jgi:hypothetical protein
MVPEITVLARTAWERIAIQESNPLAVARDGSD